jgi:hypothetical protein
LLLSQQVPENGKRHVPFGLCRPRGEHGPSIVKRASLGELAQDRFADARLPNEDKRGRANCLVRQEFDQPGRLLLAAHDVRRRSGRATTQGVDTRRR